MTLLAVALGGALGALARYLVDLWVRSRVGSAFPYGILAINVTGSELLGFVTGWPSTTASAVPPAC